MLGISVSYRQEVLSINKDSALLHNSEGSFSSSLLNVPEEFVFDAIFNCRKSCFAFLSVQFAVLVLVEELRDHVITTSNVTITI